MIQLLSILLIIASLGFAAHMAFSGSTVSGTQRWGSSAVWFGAGMAGPIVLGIVGGLLILTLPFAARRSRWLPTALLVGELLASKAPAMALYGFAATAGLAIHAVAGA